MQLHRPVQLLVLRGAEEQHRGLELRDFGVRQRLARRLLGEDGFNRGIIRRLIDHIIQAVVRQTAVILVEVRHALFQRRLQVREGVDFHLRRLFQLGDVRHEVRLLDVDCLVRTPCGQHVRLEGLVRQQLLVILQRIHRVVGGADGFGIAHGNQAARGVAGLLQRLVSEVPHFVSGLGAQRTVIAEEALQFQMRPVVQRIANCLADNLRPLAELLVVARAAGDVVFIHARAAHQAPLVVVAAQPDLRDVLEALVFPNFLGADVAVVVDDGAGRGIVVVELARRLGVQQEILIHEGGHTS